MARARSRLGLVVVLMIVAAGLGETASAWVQQSASGHVGVFRMIDTRTLAGAVCRNDLRVAPGSGSIEARDVQIASVAGIADQTMSAQYQLYQELPSGALDFVAQSPVEHKLAEASGWASFGPHTFENQPLGPRYVVIVMAQWFDARGIASGLMTIRVSNYETRNQFPQGDDFGTIQNWCVSPLLPRSWLTTAQGTVQSAVGYSLRYYPLETRISLLWDGKAIGTVTTSTSGTAISSFPAPAAPMGRHRVQFVAGSWESIATFTVVPRVKVIPSLASRGQTVNVSLRGYAAREVVRIRWKRGTSWVEVGRLTTSGTGSANLFVKVPSWAIDGRASVRGDGQYGRAQTSALTVSGGAVAASHVNTSTPTPTLMPSSTSTPHPTPTSTSTLYASTPSPIPTESLTVSPTPMVETPTEEPKASPVAVLS